MQYVSGGLPRLLVQTFLMDHSLRNTNSWTTYGALASSGVGEQYVALDTSGFDDRLAVYQDDKVPGHYFIRAKDSKDMEEWVQSKGGIHPLTQSLIDVIIKPKKRKVP